MGSRIRESVDSIFNCFCEVICPQPDETAHIKDKFPESYQELDTLNSVIKFTYPCEFEHSSIQHYSFVLTNEDSKWTFGFCRYDPKTDSALVLLSSLPWHDTFYKLLNHISEVRYSSNPVEHRKHFLKALYTCDIPTNGKLVIPWLEYTFVCCCPNPRDLPSIPENRNLTEYYSAVDAHNMAAIFASLLHERRVVFVSKRLPRLSACVQAAAALLYPMHWQHVFIPILPQSLVDYVLAPMPFLIGAPFNVFEIVNKNDIADVVVFNADNNTLQSPFDDLQNLPSEVVLSLRRELRSLDMLGDSLSRAFLRALVSLIGGYRDALRFHPGQRITFHSDAFVQSRPPAIQPFLHKILQLQIFQQFIEERLHLLNEGLGFSDEFEQEICLHSGKNSSRLRQQYKEWKYTFRREGSAFFKTVRSKVREHGKEVRAACKDFKTRLKDRADTANTVSSRSKNGEIRSQCLPHRPRAQVKASASYKRPLQVSKGQVEAAVTAGSSFKPERLTFHTVAHSNQVDGGSPLPSIPTAPASAGARSSDAELMREYGLDFAALSLHAHGNTSQPSSPSLPLPTTVTVLSRTSSPGSDPPTPPSSSPPPLTPPPVRPSR